MAGFFDNLFGDDETAGFFDGDRPRGETGFVGGANTGVAVPVSDQTPAPTSAAGGNAPDILRYPNGEAVRDSNGQPYLRPPGFDMQKNLAIGQTIKDAAEDSDLNIGQANPSLMFAPLFLPGSTMDYQRPHGAFGHREMQSRPIGYYNYGVMAAKVGYGRDEAVSTIESLAVPYAIVMASMATIQKNTSARV